ncbi:MAG: flagellar biosynthesis protein FlhA [Opitutales bacterium]|nr:flagellar biosynthesis protein FlhA [Opitutales bacterium]
MATLPVERNFPALNFLKRSPDILFVLGLFGAVFILVLPIPPAFLDFLFSISIGLALLIMLLIIYIKYPPDFSVFPTLLLAFTLFRLGLNVASTRLILLEGFAGNVINSFGEFVVRGNYVVGAVVFLILVIVNFMVITKGAGRIAEVAARFTLDAMPGKQMSIDAELNAGLIDEQTASKRREKIQREADFYGAMDGASKFVRGDAVAGILITLINVVGGFAIGVMQKQLSLTEALQTYTLLSVGDGLVSQIPSLIVSFAAGVLVTRTNETADLGTSIGNTVTDQPRAVAITGGLIMVFSIIPGMPAIPFLLLGGATCTAAYFISKKRKQSIEELGALPGAGGQHALEDGSQGPGEDGDNPNDPGEGAHSFENLISTEAFSVELGYGLLSLAKKGSGGDLLERITGLRKSLAKELGLIVPPVAVRDNLELEANNYRFLLRGKMVAEGKIMPERWLAMNVSNSSVSLKGTPTKEPVFGLDAVWVTEAVKKNAEINGYTVVDATSVMITHLSETLKSLADLILDREDVQRLIDLVKDKNPTLINELLPDLVSVGLIQRVLRNLLKEGIPIRNLTVILETIADFAPFTKNPDDLSEQVRRRIGVYFMQQYEAEDGIVNAVTLEPRLDQLIASQVKRTQTDVGITLDPSLTQHLLAELNQKIEDMTAQGFQPILITSADVRLPFKRFFEPSFPQLIVLSYQEFPGEIQIQTFSIITLPNELNPLMNEAADSQHARAS